MVVVIGKLLVTFFSTLIARCGLRWHIGFTVQDRFTWGLRGSYIPLLQRVVLNFIWCAIQCWNGVRLDAVCITAIWPSIAKMHNTLPSSMPTTTYQFVSFVLFWVLSVPFLFVRPEKFHLPFLVTSIYCGLGMLCMMIWSLSVAKGVGPLWMTGQNIPETSSWNLHWLEMKGINQIIGGIAAGTTNGSDFSRHARSSESYIVGTVLSAWITGVLVSLVGLVVTAACQKIYGEVYWNPPDLLMRMMDSGEALRKGRIQLSHLYRTRDTAYWYTKGVNWRAIPAWICVWAPTIGGLLVTVGGMSDPLRSLVKLYYMAFLVGFFVSGTVFYLLNLVFPYPGLGEYEKVDVYETFTPCEAASLGVVPVGEPEVLDGVEFGPGDDKTEHGSIVEKSVRDAEIPCRRWNLV